MKRFRITHYIAKHVRGLYNIGLCGAVAMTNIIDIKDEVTCLRCKKNKKFVDNIATKFLIDDKMNYFVIFEVKK